VASASVSEAALALGFRRGLMLRLIILPQALRVIHYLLEQQPGSAALLRLKLSALLRLGKAERTAAFVAELDRREWGAGDAPYLTSIAGLFLQSGKLALAGEWLDRVDRLSPGSADAVQLRARIAFAERRYDELGELCARLAGVGSPQQQFEAHLLRARAAHNSGAAVAAGKQTEVAVLAGGCFWGVQGVFQHVDGVTSAVSGYAGGSAPQAQYEIVSRGRSGHAEAMRSEVLPSSRMSCMPTSTTSTPRTGVSAVVDAASPVARSFMQRYLRKGRHALVTDAISAIRHSALRSSMSLA